MLFRSVKDDDTRSHTKVCLEVCDIEDYEDEQIDNQGEEKTILYLLKVIASSVIVRKTSYSMSCIFYRHCELQVQQHIGNILLFLSIRTKGKTNY